MPYINTTFLPKTNGLVFADRLVARSDKGRVFGLGRSAIPLAFATGQGSTWVNTNVYEVGQTIQGKTTKYTGGVQPVTYRYRFQFRATGSNSWVSDPWTTTTNAANLITYTLTEPGRVRIQSQAIDADGIQIRRVNLFKTVINPTTP